MCQANDKVQAAIEAIRREIDRVTHPDKMSREDYVQFVGELAGDVAELESCVMDEEEAKAKEGGG
jgi:hypothetical protein